MITYVLAVLVLLPVVLLIAAAVRGHVEVRPCCAADPTKDLRMRAAFADERTDR